MNDLLAKVTLGCGKPIDLGWYGFDVDNTPENNTACFERAVSDMIAGSTLTLAPSSTQYKVTNLVFNPDHDDCTLNLNNAVLYSTAPGTALTIGGPDRSRKRYKVKGVRVTSNGILWEEGRVGVDVTNLFGSTVEVLEAIGFEKGLQVSGKSSTGCVHNTFRLGWFINNKNQVYLDADDLGWTNANIFYGGALQFTGAITEWNGTTGIYVAHYPPNNLYNNVFYNPSIECNNGGVGIARAAFIDGKHTHINTPYHEPTGDQVFPFVFGENSSRCTLIGSSFVGKGDIIDDGKFNLVWQSDDYGSFFTGLSFGEGMPRTRTRARRYLGIDQSNLVNNVPTSVQLNAESYDTGSNFTNSGFIAPIDGYYLIVGQLTYTHIINPTTGYAHIYVNGAAKTTQRKQLTHTGNHAFPINDIIYLRKGDCVELYAHVLSSANTIDIWSGESITYLAIHLLSE